VLASGELWANGETGEQGNGTFPRPTGDSCQVIFHLQNGPSAPIPLAFLPDATVIPTRSRVRIATGDCCSPPPRPIPRSSPASPPITRSTVRNAITVAVTVATGICLCLVWWRTRRVIPTN
jgi:hypothetical protein